MLAGTYRIAAPTMNAQVYWIALLRRHSSRVPQRGQCPGFAALTGRTSSPHASQETSPASSALSAVAVILLFPNRLPHLKSVATAYRRPTGCDSRLRAD